MKEVAEPKAQYTDYGTWLHIEVPAGTTLGKELRSFFKSDVLSRASSTVAEDWQSFVIGDPLGFTTALELARWHFPDIVQIVPETSNFGTSTEAADAEKGASMSQHTRDWYAETGLTLPDGDEPGF